MISQMTEGFINFNIKLTLQLSDVITDIPETFTPAEQHTHTVCVTYYKAAPYNISHTKIFSRAK